MRIIAMFCALALFAPCALSQSISDENAIRQRRATSNASIARHDTGGIGATMAEDIIVVTSRSSQSVGRAANVTSFADQFRSRPDVIYVRTPAHVRVYEPWGMASEQGQWSGSWTDADGMIQIGGSYFAKWRRKNGSWLIESETYVPDRCTGGAYCRTPPP